MNPHLEIHQKVALMLKMNNQVETLLDKHKGKFRVPQPDAFGLDSMVRVSTLGDKVNAVQQATAAAATKALWATAPAAATAP